MWSLTWDVLLKFARFADGLSGIHSFYKSITLTQTFKRRGRGIKNNPLYYLNPSEKMFLSWNLTSSDLNTKTVKNTFYTVLFSLYRLGN